MFKKLIGFLVISLLFVSVSPKTALAHVLKASGSVGAVIHISPEDDPIAGEQSDFFFEFKDKEGKFTPDTCDCTASVIQGYKEIYTQPLFQSNSNPSLTSASFSYTFPQKDIYHIKIVGKPNTPNAFNPFILDWTIRVERVSNNPSASGNALPVESNGVMSWAKTHIPHIIGGVILSVLVIFALMKGNRPKTT